MNRYFSAVLFSAALFSFACGRQTFDNPNLVEVRSINPNIQLDIRYATDSNFTHQRLYSVAKCYLRKEAAESLSAVQKELEKMGLGLKVFDGYRPLSIQKKMWKIFPDDRYVANPATGSRHNRGAAVDVTLVDSLGHELEMPTGFDDFTDRAHRDYNNLPKNEIQDRKFLQEVMERHGFVGLSTEWWHFDLKDWKKYPIVDIPIK
ncbi:MAG: D-alanyl-D-alanine dipeptidase [Bacteroidetes bacterium]|nr:D-alanyl-D-alanine dipeptidase [Bacteroidota bacterium]